MSIVPFGHHEIEGHSASSRLADQPTEARLAIFDFTEGFYNTRRRHSAIDYDPPLNYERRFHSLPNPESDNLSTETG